MCIVIVNQVINFEINLSNQAIFSTLPKSQAKKLDMLRTKRAFKRK